MAEMSGVWQHGSVQQGQALQLQAWRMMCSTLLDTGRCYWPTMLWPEGVVMPPLVVHHVVSHDISSAELAGFHSIDSLSPVVG